MEFDRLKKIIVKDILGSASGEERRLLDEWRNQSEEHQRLYEKLVSGSFLEKAVSDNNKALRRREWKRLEARIVRRRFGASDPFQGGCCGLYTRIGNRGGRVVEQ